MCRPSREMGRPSWRQEITPGGRGADSADQISVLSRCVSCLAIILSSCRFIVRPVRAPYETRAICPLNFLACPTAGQVRPCSQYHPCRSKNTRCGVFRPSTVSSTRYRNCTEVSGPHLRIGSSGRTATRTTGSGRTAPRRPTSRNAAFLLLAFFDFVYVTCFTALRVPFFCFTAWRVPFVVPPPFDVAFAVVAFLAGFFAVFLRAFVLTGGDFDLPGLAGGAPTPLLMLRSPVTPAAFLTFATSAPRLCNRCRVSSGFFRYRNLEVSVTYVNGRVASFRTRRGGARADVARQA